MSITKNYYDILELSRDASQEQIKRAYRILARKYHPDSSMSGLALDKTFHDIQEAYETLSDPARRADYDRLNRAAEQDAFEKTEAYRRSQARQQYQTSSTNSGGPNAEDPWNVLKNQSANTGRAFSGAYEGRSRPDSGARFAGSTIFRKPEEEPNSKGSRKRSDSFIARLKDGVLHVLEKGMEGEGSEADSGPSGIVNELRGEKTVEFTIDAMESLRGTTREVTLDEDNGPRMIRVRIPQGVKPDATLRVNAPATEVHPPRRLRVKVRIEPHPLVEREGLDIILKIPVTIPEAIKGAELQVPTLSGPVKVRIPPGWGDNRRLRVKGRGIVEADGGAKGDLYIKTFLVLPKDLHSKPQALEAAELLEGLYREDVRNDIPEDLGKD